MKLKLKFFSQSACPKCPAAKKVVEELKARGIPVEFYDVKTVEGKAEAMYYGLMSTPSTVITDNSDVEIRAWRGELPDSSKILELFEKEKSGTVSPALPKAAQQGEPVRLRVNKVRKRDGRIVPFDKEKITEAIWKAAQSVDGKDHALSAALADEVAKIINSRFDESNMPEIEDIQDIVEKVLVENGHFRTAKSYILYRRKRAIIRAQKEALLNFPVD
jgi:thiol-disulfide isomerase/thioredoxin